MKMKMNKARQRNDWLEHWGRFKSSGTFGAGVRMAASARGGCSFVGWRLATMLENGVKRTLDLTLSALGLILLLPLLLLIALMIRAESNGPVLFRQTRVGRRGRTFCMLKFRSMATDAEQRRGGVIRATACEELVRFKSKTDPRITRVGRVLRRFSLDELPQLWNVLVGEMALVGPRPPIPEETRKYSALDWRRLDSKPGLTCTWQVSGRADIPFEEQVTLDVAYIESRSLLRDLKLMAATLPAVLSGRGAY